MPDLESARDLRRTCWRRRAPPTAADVDYVTRSIGSWWHVRRPGVPHMTGHASGKRNARHALERGSARVPNGGSVTMASFVRSVSRSRDHGLQRRVDRATYPSSLGTRFCNMRLSCSADKSGPVASSPFGFHASWALKPQIPSGVTRTCLQARLVWRDWHRPCFASRGSVKRTSVDHARVVVRVAWRWASLSRGECGRRMASRG